MILFWSRPNEEATGVQWLRGPPRRSRDRCCCSEVAGSGSGYRRCNTGRTHSEEIREARAEGLVTERQHVLSLHLKLRDNRHVQNSAVYVALALNAQGHKELLGLWVGQAEGAKFWLSILTELKNRGVEDVLIAAVDGLKGFPDAIAAVYPRTQVQLCIVHMVRNSLRYVSWKYQREVAGDLRKIYTAPTIEAAEAALEVFSARWDETTPLISRLWRTHWANLIPFFDFPPSIRKVIYTTNAIESIQAQLRKVTKKRGAFPTEMSVRKVLYLALMKAKERWTMPIRDWQTALYHLSLVFPGRVQL